MIGLIPAFFAFLIEIYDSEHCPVVGYGKAFHAQLFGVGHQIGYPGRSVQQTVFGMNM